MKYMKNVYHINRSIQKLTDGRIYPKYKTAQTIIPLLFGFMLRIKSMNELKCMPEEDEFKNSISREILLPPYHNKIIDTTQKP